MARKGPFKDLAWGRLNKGKTSKTKVKRSNASHQRTGLMSQLKQVAGDAATPKNEPSGPMKGIVLHVYKTDPSAAAGSSWMTTWYDEILGVPLPETIKMKVRIPTLHAGIPEPEEYGCGSSAGKHWFWINMHPTFYASSQDVEAPECGDVVIVSVDSPSEAGHGGGGLVLSTVVTRENNPIKKGAGCPPSEAFPDAAETTAEGADGDAIGGEEVSALPVNPFGLPADCDFDCMVDFMSSISTLPQVAAGRNPDGSLNPIASPFDKKGIFISRDSLSDKNMPTPLMALVRALWADLRYVVFECVEQTATHTYKTDRDLLNIYARMFSLGGLQVYVSGTPYPGQAAKFVDYMTDTVVDIGAKGMVMSPSWGYLSPGNKNKYARQASYLTNAMMRAAKAARVQLGFTNSWLPSAEYTVAEVDGEEGSVSIRYKDSFPYSCFTGVDWSICQILSRNGRSEVEINESTGEITLLSLRGSNAMVESDFVQALRDYTDMGFKNIVPAFGAMGNGYEDYRVSFAKPPARMRAELDFLAAIQVPSLIGEVAEDEDDPSFLPIAGMAQRAFTVQDWGTGYFGLENLCDDADPDVRCLPPPETPWETLDEIIDTASDAADVLEDATGMSEFGDIGDALDVASDAVDKAEEVTSQIWPTFPPEDPIVKSRIVNSVMWWDWLNAEKHTPCWKSTRWDVIKHFHRYSPIAMERAMESGSDTDDNFDVFTKRIQNAIAAIEAYNRIAEQNPSMMKTSLEAYLLAVESAPVATTFDGSSEMESFGQAASAVAQSSGTEMGYDGEGSASGGGTDADDLIDDAADYADSDAYFGSDHTEEGADTGASGDTGDADAATDDTGGAGTTQAGQLDAYPPFPYIKLDSPVGSGDQGGYYPAYAGTGASGDRAFSEGNRTPANINFVVIHTTAGYSQKAGGEVFCKDGASVSTHYGVNTGGWVYMFVKEKDIAHGNGGSTTHGDPPASQGGRRNLAGGQDKLQSGMNTNGISIEITGMPEEEANQPGKFYTQEAMSNLALLVANICKRNQISVDRTHIFGHDEMTLRKSDPGTKLDNPYPQGISYPYAGTPDGGVTYPGANGRFQINSYSPNAAGKETFDWVMFMGLVEGFFNGSGTPLPPNSSFPAGAPGASGAGASTGGAAASCAGGAAAPGSAGGGTTPPGAPLTAEQIAQLGQFQGAWPSGGSPALTSDFGQRKPPFLGENADPQYGSAQHGGLDIISWEPGSSGNPGTIPLFAIADGTVTSVGSYSCKIEHANGLATNYVHNESTDVQTGQQVTKGQIIGTMGTKGPSSGVHLHFELRVNGDLVDPMSALGLECNARAKGDSSRGYLCRPGNQNVGTPSGPF
jgi:hypothetical protein